MQWQVHWLCKMGISPHVGVCLRQLMTCGDQRILLAQYLEALQLLRHLSSQQTCELRHCYYPHCSDGQLKHGESVVEASLNGQVNLQLAATKRDGVVLVQKSCLTQGLQQGRKTHPGFLCYRLLLHLPVNPGYPPDLQVEKYLTAPARGAGTLRLGPSKQAPKPQNHHNSWEEAKVWRSKVWTISLPSEISYQARCTYTAKKPICFWQCQTSLCPCTS